MEAVGKYLNEIKAAKIGYGYRIDVQIRILKRVNALINAAKTNILHSQTKRAMERRVRAQMCK